MAENPTHTLTEAVETPLPHVDHLLTEDDTPVDNIFSAQQQELLTSTLNTSWEGRVAGESFVALANVGLYYSVHEQALVPDMMLSVDVRLSDNIWEKRHRSYLIWEYGKSPDVVIEIVSNTVGGETDEKIERYARASVPYYAIFDPLQQVQDEKLVVYCLNLPLRLYERCRPDLLPGVGLGLTLWQGEYGGWEDLWLRWIDVESSLIATGKEAAGEERRRARQLAAKLRELGVDPDSVI